MVERTVTSVFIVTHIKQQVSLIDGLIVHTTRLILQCSH